MAKQTGSYDFTAARAAAEMADDISQHFWTKSTGGTTDIPTGSYITEVPQEEFTDPNHVNYCAGGNLLMRSNSIKIRNAQTILSEFDANGMYIYAGGNKIAEFTGTEANITNASGYKLQLKGGDINFIPTTGVGAYIDFLASNYIKMRYNHSTAPSEVKCEYGQVTVTGNIATSDKATFGALDNGVFTVTTETVFASTSISGNAHKYGTVTINDSSHAKYYPLGIVGWNSPSTSQFVPSRLRLSARAVGSAEIAYDIRNVYSSSGTSNVTCDILWLKVTA